MLPLRNGFRWIVIAGALMAAPQALEAQQITGSLQFDVQDSLGDPVPGANASVSGPALQGIQGTVSDAQGRCKVPSLPPGVLSLRISHPAYQTVVIQEARVQLGKTTDLGSITLHQMVHDMPELVISGGRSDINANSTTYGSNVRPAELRDLPLGRSYTDMITMLPLTNTSYFGDGPNIGGSTGYENKFFVDGIEVTDPLAQRDGTALPYNFVQEVEVKAGGYEADSRSTLGGVLNVVTYSGTNEFHGSAFGFYTSDRFAGNRQIGLSDPTQGGFSKYDAGLSLGGPLLIDRVWFFAAYNPTFTRTDVDIPGYGIFVDRTLVSCFAAKVTWKASEPLRFVLTATGDPTSQKAVGNGVGAPPQALLNSDPYFMKIYHGGINASLAGTYTLGGEMLLEGSIARVNRHDTGDPATQRGYEPWFIDHQATGDVLSGGTNSRWDSFRYATMGNLAFSLIAGGHSAKAGVEYKVNGTDNRYQVDHIDQWSDTTFVENAVGAGETVHDNLASLFIQDVWQITRSFSLHAGIRWDGQEIVGSRGTVAQKVIVPVQPRLGFTYALNREGTRKIFGSLGRFSQEYALFQSVNMFSDQGYSSVLYYHQDPRIPGTAPDFVQGAPLKILPGVEGLHGQYYDEFTLGYEQTIGGGGRVRLDGVYRTLRETIDDAFIASSNTWILGNPGRGPLSAWPRAQRDYLAGVLTFTWTNDRRFSVLSSLVLSRDYGNYSGIFDGIGHNEFPNTGTAFDDLESTKLFGKGLLPNDRPVVFKFAGSYRFDFGLTTGFFFLAESGTPLSEMAGTDFTDVLLAPRGTGGRTPSVWDLNARIAYDLPQGSLLRARLILDLFHIASQRAVVDINQWRGYIDAYGQFWPDQNYGRANRYQPPMSARLGMEVSF